MSPVICEISPRSELEERSVVACLNPIHKKRAIENQLQTNPKLLIYISIFKDQEIFADTVTSETMYLLLVGVT
jgi:hypothetical protein